MDLMYRNASRLDARDYASGYLYLALNIGEQMLMCGAEVHRVEDCIRRICTAYGAVRVDVFSITSSIVVTMYGPDFGSLTQTRRISRQNTDMYRLDRLNQLSRDICSAVPPLSEAADELKAIKKLSPLFRRCAADSLRRGVGVFYGVFRRQLAGCCGIGNSGNDFDVSGTSAGEL